MAVHHEIGPDTCVVCGGSEGDSLEAERTEAREAGEVNLNQPVTYIVLGVLGLMAWATGILTLLAPGKAKTILGQVSGVLLMLVSLGCLIFGFYHLHSGGWMDAGGFFLVAIALVLAGWFFLDLGVKERRSRSFRGHAVAHHGNVMAPHDHIPLTKQGFFGTDRIGHFYEEVSGITKQNKNRTSRQEIIRDELYGLPQLLLETDVDDANRIRVTTTDGEQIGYFLARRSKQIICDRNLGYQYTAFVDGIFEWKPFEVRTRYGVVALIFRVAPGVSDEEIHDYVCGAFPNPNFSDHYLKKVGIDPATRNPVVSPTPTQLQISFKLKMLCIQAKSALHYRKHT
jgi:hypothetical protein